MSRCWKTPLLLLTLLAALGVLTRELPECLTLSDDVSNDGDAPILLQKQLLERIAVFENRNLASPSCLAAAPSQESCKLAVSEPASFSPRSARGLLLLLCVQRK
jgi:hypothetical protein